MSREIIAPTKVEKDGLGGETATLETHPAFGLIGVGRSQGTGSTLFDSDIPHRHTITVTVREAQRERTLNHDRISAAHGRANSVLAKVRMSEAQWASFVSSMNTGDGVPCTIEQKAGDWNIPELPAEARLQESMNEVRAAGENAIKKIEEALKAVEEKPTKANIRDLRAMVNNAPSNMEFAAKSLTEHAENVVQRSRADLEAIVVAKAQQLGLDPSELGSLPQLGTGSEDADV